MPDVNTSIGPINIKRAGIQDEETVLGIMRDAAKWLQEKGIPQWEGVLTEKGRDLVHQRIEAGLAYVAAFNGENIGTVSIQWTDQYAWDGKGLDGSAGYIHGLAVLRRFAGKKVGLDILKWAMETIRAEKPKVRLDCMGDNPRLCRYYEGLGFSLVGQKSFPNGWKANLYEKG